MNRLRIMVITFILLGIGNISYARSNGMDKMMSCTYIPESHSWSIGGCAHLTQEELDGLTPEDFEGLDDTNFTQVVISSYPNNNDKAKFLHSTPGFFKAFKNLRSLIFKIRVGETFNPDIFVGLPNLKSLEIGFVNEIPDRAFSRLGPLDSLKIWDAGTHISMRAMEDAPIIGSLHIQLYGNNQQIEDGAFSTLGGVARLYLFTSNLVITDDTLRSLSTLKGLSLNNVKSISENAFAGLPILKTVEIKDLKSSLPDRIFANQEFLSSFEVDFFGYDLDVKIKRSMFSADLKNLRFVKVNDKVVYVNLLE